MLTKSLVVYDTSLGQVLRTIGREPKGSVNLNNVPLKYEVKLSEETFRLLQRHTLIKQEIQLEMIKIGQDLVRTAFATHTAGAGYDAALRARTESMLVIGQAKVDDLIDRKLKHHALMDKAWGDYYKSQRKELIFAAVGLGMSAVSIGLAVPTGGASIAVAVVAGARSLVTGATKLVECWRTAEQVRENLVNSITRLTDAYKRSVGQGRAMQIGGAAVNATGILPAVELLPFVRGQLMPSLGGIESGMGIYKGKLGSLYAAANELAGDLFDLLDRAESLRNAHLGQALPQLDKLERQIDALLSSGTSMARFRGKLTVSSAYMRYKSGYNALTVLDTLILQLKGLEKHPDAVNRLAKIVTVLTNVALTLPNYANALALAHHANVMQIAEGMGIATKEGTGAAAKTAMNSWHEILGTSLGWAGDIMGTGKDFVELGKEFGLGPGDIPAQPNHAAQMMSVPTVLPPPHTVPVSSAPRISRPPNRPPPPVPVVPTVSHASTPPPNRPPPPLPPRPGRPLPPIPARP